MHKNIKRMENTEIDVFENAESTKIAGIVVRNMSCENKRMSKIEKTRQSLEDEVREKNLRYYFFCKRMDKTGS